VLVVRVGQQKGFQVLLAGAGVGPAGRRTAPTSTHTQAAHGMRVGIATNCPVPTKVRYARTSNIKWHAGYQAAGVLVDKTFVGSRRAGVCAGPLQGKTQQSPRRGGGVPPGHTCWASSEPLAGRRACGAAFERSPSGAARSAHQERYGRSQEPRRSLRPAPAQSSGRASAAATGAQERMRTHCVPHTMEKP
jgi:hypothetical protein